MDIATKTPAATTLFYVSMIDT